MSPYHLFNYGTFVNDKHIALGKIVWNMGICSTIFSPKSGADKLNKN